MDQKEFAVCIFLISLKLLKLLITKSFLYNKLEHFYIRGLHLDWKRLWQIVWDFKSWDWMTTSNHCNVVAMFYVEPLQCGVLEPTGTYWMNSKLIFMCHVLRSSENISYITYSQIKNCNSALSSVSVIWGNLKGVIFLRDIYAIIYRERTKFLALYGLFFSLTPY